MGNGVGHDCRELCEQANPGIPGPALELNLTNRWKVWSGCDLILLSGCLNPTRQSGGPRDLGWIEAQCDIVRSATWYAAEAQFLACWHLFAQRAHYS